MESVSAKEERPTLHTAMINHPSSQIVNSSRVVNGVAHNGYSDFEKEFLQFSQSKDDVDFSSNPYQKQNRQTESKMSATKPLRKSPYSTLSGMVVKKYRKHRKRMLSGLRKNVRFVFSNDVNYNNATEQDNFTSSHTQSIKDLSSDTCVLNNLDTSDHVCSDLSMSEMGSELSGNRNNGYSPFNSSNSCGSPECNVITAADQRNFIRNHTDASSVDSQDDSQDEDVQKQKYSCIPEQNNNAESAENCSCTGINQKPLSPNSQNSSDTEDYIDVVSLEGDNDVVDIEMVLDQQLNSQQNRQGTNKHLSVDVAMADVDQDSDHFVSLPNSSHYSSSKSKPPVSPIKWQQQFMSFLSTSNHVSDQSDICTKNPLHSGRKKRSRRVRHSVCACCLGGSPSHGKRKRHHSEGGEISYSRKRHSVSGTHKRFIRDMVQLVSLRNKIMKLLHVLFPNNPEMEDLMNCDTERVDELIDDVIDILRSPDYDAKEEIKNDICMDNFDIGDKQCDSPACPQLLSLVDSSTIDEQNEAELDDFEMPVLSIIDYKSGSSCRDEDKGPPDKENSDTRVEPDENNQLPANDHDKNDIVLQNTPPDDLTELDNVLHRFLSQVDTPESNVDSDSVENKLDDNPVESKDDFLGIEKDCVLPESKIQDNSLESKVHDSPQSRLDNDVPAVQVDNDLPVNVVDEGSPTIKIQSDASDEKVELTSVDSRNSESSYLQICGDNEQSRKISEADSVLESGNDNFDGVPEDYQGNKLETDSALPCDSKNGDELLPADHVRPVSEADSGIGCEPDTSNQCDDSHNVDINQSDESHNVDINQSDESCVMSDRITKCEQIQNIDTQCTDSEPVSFVNDCAPHQCLSIDEIDCHNSDSVTEGLMNEVEFSPVKSDSDMEPLLLPGATSDIASPLMVRTDDPFLNDRSCFETPLRNSAISDSLSGTPIDQLKIKSERKHLEESFELSSHESNKCYPTICHEMASSISSTEKIQQNTKTIDVFDVSIAVCKKPKVCLKAFKKRLYTILRWLLPHLQFRNYFFKNLDNLEFLLDTIISCNESNKTVKKSQQV